MSFRYLFLVAAFCLSQAFATDIVLTFDDAPFPYGQLYSSAERMELLLKKLEGHPAVFFVVGEYLEMPKGKQEVEKICASGKTIGNHSFIQTPLSLQTFDQFKMYFLAADILLSEFFTFHKWYRYPYLDYGVDAQQARVFSFLQDRDYKVAFVTIYTLDYYFNQRLQEALSEGKQINFDRFEEIYLDLLSEWMDYAEEVRKRNKIEVTHVIDLHQNDLNARFMTGILQMIKKKGWTIISAENVFFDRFDHEDYLRIQKPFLELEGEIFKKSYIDQLFVEKEVFR